MTELELERRVRKLAGETLQRVLYQHPPREEPREDEHREGGPHSVGLAVFVECESGVRFRIGWGDDFGLHHGWGVTIGETRVIDRDAGVLEDVSGHAAWRTLIGSRITSAAVQWQSIRDAIRGNLFTSIAIGADHFTRRDFPQTIELLFDGGAAVFVAAARIGEEGRAEVFTNNLLVVFGSESRDALGLRPLTP